MTETVVSTAKQQSAVAARPEERRVTPAQPKAKRSGGRLRALDGLRLVAALMVALYHYGGRGGEITAAWGTSPKTQFPMLHSWFSYGCLGVQVFFVISGFVICMSGWGRPLRSFFASRASRLLPAYWAAVLLVTVVFALPTVAYKALSPSDVLVNLTMLQMPLGVDRVLGVCWTLWAEVRFYALFALCIVLPGANRRRVILFCAGWTLAAPRSPSRPRRTAERDPDARVRALLHRRCRPVPGAPQPQGRLRLGHRGRELPDRAALRGAGPVERLGPERLRPPHLPRHHADRRLRLRGGPATRWAADWANGAG